MNDLQRNVKILVIAPYIGLVKFFEQAVSKRDNIELTAYESDTDEAAVFIRSIPVENYDIIISRGYTCKLIEKACRRHVLDVGISIYDVLRTIRLAQNYEGKFAVVGFHSIIYYAIVLKDVLRFQFDIFTIQSTDEIEGELTTLKNMGYSMIVGDVVTTKIAKRIGLQTILITTSPESVEAVLDNSLSLYKEQMAFKRERAFYRDLLSNANENITVFDECSLPVFTNRNDCDSIQKSLKRYVPSLLERREMNFVKTIGDIRYLIRGKVIYFSNRPMAVFFFRGIEKWKKDSGLLSFLDTDDGPAVSQRIFYTLSPALKNALSKIDSFQFYSKPVLITGPKGSGKDSFASFLHQKSRNQNNPMAIIDCKFADDKDWNYLLKNEDSPLFETGYTLFFKDTHLLNPEQQEQLLLFLNHTALNKRSQLVFSCVPGVSASFDQGILKNELVNILKALIIRIPSLNERREDIPNLATLYLNEFNSQMAKQAIAFEPEALALLQNFNWTDNLHQLRSVIQELILCSESSFITEEEVRMILGTNKSEASSSQDFLPVSLEGTLEDITRRIIKQVLKEENMNQSSAAKRLGIGRSTLRRHLQ
ncbi:MAG: PrpR N-terminal domain-containing protein [Clostridium sp.]|jgi:hypothetical protein